MTWKLVGEQQVDAELLSIETRVSKVTGSTYFVCRFKILAGPDAGELVFYSYFDIYPHHPGLAYKEEDFPSIVGKKFSLRIKHKDSIGHGKYAEAILVSGPIVPSFIETFW